MATNVEHIGKKNEKNIWKRHTKVGWQATTRNGRSNGSGQATNMYDLQFHDEYAFIFLYKIKFTITLWKMIVKIQLNIYLVLCQVNLRTQAKAFFDRNI